MMGMFRAGESGAISLASIRTLSKKNFNISA